MAKKLKVEGKIVEETEFYKVIKSRENGKFYIFCKFNDGYYTADNYKIIGSAVLQDEKGSKQYWNTVNWQPFGQGRSLCYVMEIDSWKTKVVDGVEQTAIKYFDEKGYKYIRYVDEQGNLYKSKKKQTKELQEVEMASL